MLGCLDSHTFHDNRCLIQQRKNRYVPKYTAGGQLCIFYAIFMVHKTLEYLCTMITTVYCRRGRSYKLKFCERV